MATAVIGATCANCGTAIPQASRERTELAYAVALGLEGPNQPGELETVAAAKFTVFRRTGQTVGAALTLCDVCMAVSVRAVCESVLTDLEAMRRGEEEPTN